jgi:hypothetical protein
MWVSMTAEYNRHSYFTAKKSRDRRLSGMLLLVLESVDFLRTLVHRRTEAKLL